MNVASIALARDSSNFIYVIEDDEVYKSTNGGTDFIRLSLPSTFDTPPRLIAVAPDSSETVAVVDCHAGGRRVWVSTNGGIIWNNFGQPKAGTNSVITDIAISPAAGPEGRRIFAAVADNRPGVTTRGDVVMREGNNWNSAGGLNTTHDYLAIRVSPDFVNDRCVYAVGATPANGVDCQVINTGTKTVESTVNFIPAGKVTEYCVPPNYNSIWCADIAVGVNTVSPEHNKVAFVSVTSNTLNPADGIYRITGQVFERLTVHPNDLGLRIKSLDFDGDGLLAGEYESTNVWVSTNPMFPNPSFDKVTVPAGTKEAVVGIRSPNCYVGTSGPRGGFFIL